MIKKIIGFLCSVIFCIAIAIGMPQIAGAEETFTGASGKSGDLKWNITQEGHLTVIGDGDYEPIKVGFADDYSQHLAPEWLKYCRNIKTAELDIKNITYTGYMFYRCRYLTSINMINFDTSKVTSMKYMFFYCNHLTGLNVSEWDTSKVTSMAWMFFCCDLYSLDVAKWDTSNVKYMEHIFQSNDNMKSLDVSDWDTSNIVNMSCMFFNCGKLAKLDVSNWDTHSVKNMASMFYGCNSIRNLDINNWNTSQVTNLQRTFAGCPLINMDISNWDVSKLGCMDGMLGDNKLLEKLSLFANSPYDVKLPVSKGYHWENENGRVCTVAAKGLPRKMTYTKVSGDTTKINPIIDALPDLNNLGDAEIKGPEISIGNNKFNLFSIKSSVSLPIFNNKYLKVKINETEQTAEILIGLKDEIKTDSENDPYWKETYQQVKSLVKACGGKVDTPKLWNKFSKLRGKLKKLDGNAVFKVSGNSAGYIKLNLDKNNGPIGLIEGGVVANLMADASTKTPICWILYSEFGLNGSVDGKICLTTENTKAIQVKGVKGELGLTIKPRIAFGADAVVVDVKGGIEGEIGGKVSFPWKSFEECVTAWLSGRLFLKINTKIPGLEWKNDKKEDAYEYEFPKLELYPELGKVEKKSLNLQYKSRSVPTKRQYNDIKNYAFDSVDKLNQSIVYENAKPDMIELPDGKILMVYLDDTVAGASEQAKLVYRLYKDGNWSEQKTVNNNMNLDTAGTLCVYNGVAYVVYENSNCTINENMQSEDILNSLDLYVAAFDASSDVFQTPIKLEEISGKSPTWKYGYNFVKGEKSFSIIWAENSAGDVLLENGDTEFYKSEYINGVWQEKEKFQSQKGAVQEFCFLESLENSGLFYVKDGVLYKDGIVFKTTDDKIDSVKIFDKNLYFRDNGQLCQLNGTEINMLNVSCTTNYSVLNGTVYWTEQNNFTSEIYEKNLSSEKNPVAITDDGGYIGSFCVITHNNEKPFLAYTLQAVDETITHGSPYGLTVLKSKGDFSRVQAEILNLAYDILSYMPGKNNDIAVTISNTGTVDLTNLEVTIYDTRGNIIHKEKISDKINPGEVLEKHLSVLIPDDMIQKEITVSILSEQEFDNSSKAEKKLELETNTADICLEKKDSDIIIIKNNGDTAENVTINIMDKNESGNILFSDNIGTLKSGETKDVLITEAWNDASLDENLMEKYLYCEVSQDAVEYALWDNSLQLQKDYSSTEPSATPSSVPTQTPSPAPSISPVVPSDAHIFSDYNYSNPVTDNETVIYGNGVTKAIDGKKVNNKVFTAYTDITASYKYTLNSRGIVKPSVGKVIVGITKSNVKPEVSSKNKITDTSASNIAKSRIKNGQITVTSVGKEGGLVYLWVIDTGNKGVSACCPIDVKLAPKKLEVQDTAGSKLKNTKLANGNTLEVCVAGLVGSTKTDDCTYTATVDSKYQSYITVTPVDGSTNKFTIKATGLKNNKDTKTAVTFKCDQNGKKTNFSLTITK